MIHFPERIVEILANNRWPDGDSDFLIKTHVGEKSISLVTDCQFRYSRLNEQIYRELGITNK